MTVVKRTLVWDFCEDGRIVQSVRRNTLVRLLVLLRGAGLGLEPEAALMVWE